MNKEEELKFDYKYLVKREKLCKSVIDTSKEMLSNRDKMEKSLTEYLEKAKSNNDELKIKRYSRELNDLRETKEPAEKEFDGFKQQLLDIYDEEDKLLKKLEKKNVDIATLKYRTIYRSED